MSQNHFQDRRPSARTASITIPRPPPLPAPRPLQLARDAASRLLGYSSRPPSPPEDRFANGNVRISPNASVSHRTGLEINTVAMNESGTHAIIGGKEIFKTIKIEDGKCTEDFNLRAAIRSSATQASGQPRQTYSIDIADVAWARGDCGDYVAAATSSGKIILYDLGHAGLQAAQLHEHSRHVHKVTFNPHRGNLLLSGSQDGTVRLWDVRDVRKQASTLQSRRKYPGQSDGVRDVKWSPTDGLDFAFGTDTGEVQRWDMRNLKSAKVKVPAHMLACNAIDWHPDGKHVLSASSDKTVRVFDVSTSRTRRANWEIKTPYPVMNARWRPSLDSSVTQVVTSYDLHHPALHIWDFRRHCLPFRDFVPYSSSSPTDLIWRSPDLLWSVGREGIFLQTDIQHTQVVIDRLNLQSMAISPLDELACVSQPRRGQKIRIPQSINPSHVSSLGTSPETDFFGRSWDEGSPDESFLSTVPAKLRVPAVGKRRSSNTASFTYENSQSPLYRLEDILLSWKSSVPRQAASRGRIPTYNNSRFISFQSQRCKALSPSHFKHPDVISIVESTFQNNARIASLCGFPSLWKTWKITGFWAAKNLEKRFKVLRERGGRSPMSAEHKIKKSFIESLSSRLIARHTKSPAPSPASQKPVFAMAAQLIAQDSTSNVPTPLARPTTSSRVPIPSQTTELPDIDVEDGIMLPPSLAKREIQASRDLARDTQSLSEEYSRARRLTEGNLHSWDNLHSSLRTVDRNDLVRKWSEQPTAPATIDLTVGEAAPRPPPPKLEKHDSNDSFKFLEEVNDSAEPSTPASAASPESESPQLVSEHPSRSKVNIQTDRTERPDTSERDVGSIAHQSIGLEGFSTLANNTDKIQSTDDTASATVEQTTTVRSRKVDSKGSEKPEGFGKRDLDSQERRAGSAPAFEHRTLAPSPPLNVAFNLAEKNEKISNDTAENIDHEKLAELPETNLVQESAELDVEDSSPWSLVEMLRELILNYTQHQPFPQAAALLLLNLGPLLPLTHPLSPTETHQTLDSYIEYFATALGWSTDAIFATINNCLEAPLKSGLQPLQIEAILLTYHDQLLSQRLFDDATVLRKRAYPAYPALYEDFIKHNDIHLRCGACGKSVSTASGAAHPRCESCAARQTTCPICWLPRSPFELAPDPRDNANFLTTDGAIPAVVRPDLSSLFASCLLCNHSAHVACARTWFGADAAGGGIVGDGCPTAGCLCDCVVGPWREEKLEAALAHRQQRLQASPRRSPKVRSDSWKARESKAVRKVRAALST